MHVANYKQPPKYEYVGWVLFITGSASEPHNVDAAPAPTLLDTKPANVLQVNIGVRTIFS
jgi:hypothetical protein